MSDVSGNQYAPNPTGIDQQAGAPGANGPGSDISVSHSMALTIGAAAGGLVALGIIFRRGKDVKIAPLRVDAANAFNVYFSWLLIHATVKTIAYRYHGHPLSQAILLEG